LAKKFETASYGALYIYIRFCPKAKQSVIKIEK